MRAVGCGQGAQRHAHHYIDSMAFDWWARSGLRVANLRAYGRLAHPADPILHFRVAFSESIRPAGEIRSSAPAVVLLAGVRMPKIACAGTKSSRRIRAVWDHSVPGSEFSSFLFSEFVYIWPVPPRTQGAYRDRHERGVGCDGRDGVARRAMPARTAKACGPDPATLGSSLEEDESAR